MHLPAKRDAKVANLSRPSQPAKPVRLHLDPLAGTKPPSVEMILHGVHAFIKHDGLRHAAADRRALV